MQGVAGCCCMAVKSCYFSGDCTGLELLSMQEAHAFLDQRGITGRVLTTPRACLLAVARRKDGGASSTSTYCYHIAILEVKIMVAEEGTRCGNTMKFGILLRSGLLMVVNFLSLDRDDMTGVFVDFKGGNFISSSMIKEDYISCDNSMTKPHVKRVAQNLGHRSAVYGMPPLFASSRW